MSYPSVSLCVLTFGLFWGIFCLRKDGSLSLINENNEKFFDLSSWKEGNIKDLVDIAIAVQEDPDTVAWPNPFLQESNMNSSDSNEDEPTSSMRRRLAQVDKWVEEEKELMSEMRGFYEDMKVKRNVNAHEHRVGFVRSGQDNPDRLPQKNAKRLLQDFPRFSPNCTDPDSVSPSCPPENLPQLCDKYNGGNLEDCFQTCKVSFCCTHDSKSKVLSPSCATAPNCRNWTPCYIAWWKLRDTIGPMTFQRVVQDDDFFNIPRNYIRDEIAEEINSVFYVPFFNRFIDDDDLILVDDDVVKNPDNWVKYQN